MPFRGLGFGLDQALGITLLGLLVASAFALEVPPTLGYWVRVAAHGLGVYALVNGLRDPADDRSPHLPKDPGGDGAAHEFPDDQANDQAVGDPPSSMAEDSPPPLPLGITVGLNPYRLADLTPSQRRWRWLQALGAVGLGLVAVGWIQWLRNQSSLGEALNPFPLGEPDLGAGALGLLLPLWAALAGGSRGWIRSLWSVALGLGLGLLYTTGSPVAIVALGGLIFTGMVIHSAGWSPWLNPRSPLRPQTRWNQSLGGGLLALGSLALGVAYHPRWPGWGNISGWNWYRHQGETAIALWQAHPLWGVGLGNTVKRYDFYRPLAAGVETLRESAFPSTVLQLFAELGLVGFGLLLLWITIFSRLGQQMALALTQGELAPDAGAMGGSAIRTPEDDRRDRWLLWGLSLGLGTYGDVSLVDFQLEALPISITLVLMGGLWVSLGQDLLPPDALDHDRQPRQNPSPQPHPSPQPTFRPFQSLFTSSAINPALWPKIQAFPLVLLALAAGLWLPWDRALALGRSGMVALSQGNPEQFYDRWEAAAQQVPWDPYYDFQMGAQLSQVVEERNAQALPEDMQADRATIDEEREFREKLLRQARKHLEYAVASSPEDLLFRRFLGFLLTDADPPKAVPHLSRAIELAPRQPFNHAMLATAFAYTQELEQKARETNPEETNPGEGVQESPTPPAPEATPGNSPNTPPETLTPSVIQALALESLVNPAFLFNNPEGLPELAPYWDQALAKALEFHDRILNNPPIPLEPVPRLVLSQQRTLLAWWQAQRQQTPFPWESVPPETLGRFNLRVQALAALDQNQPQAALDLLQGDSSPGGALLRAWIAPDQFLDGLFLQPPPNPVLASRLGEVVQSIQGDRQLASWLQNLPGQSRLLSRGIGFLFYRNSTGPDTVRLPDTVAINLLVEALDWFPPVGSSEAFDRALGELHRVTLNLSPTALRSP